MATVDAFSLDPIGPTLGGFYQQTAGRAALVAGTIELDTGLNKVHHIECTCLGDTADETVVFRVREDLPSDTGVITIQGTHLPHGSPIAAATTEEFSWRAVGE
jgi:hypothetical protein